MDAIPLKTHDEATRPQGKAEDKIAQHKTETALAARAMGDIKGKGKGMMGKGMMMDEMKGPRPMPNLRSIP